MKKISSIVFVVMSVAYSAIAQGEASFVYVSADNGSDTSLTCSRSAPCRQISNALGKVVSGGNVVVISSGGYDGFTIAKSANILAETGVHAVVSGSPTAVSISALTNIGHVGLSNLRLMGVATHGGTGISVTSDVSSILLSGIVVSGGGTGGAGVRVSGEVDAFEIENCSISGSEYDLRVIAAGEYRIRDSEFKGTVQGTIFSASERINGVIENTRFRTLTAGANARILVRASTTSFGGMHAKGVGARLFLENCTSSYSHTDGVSASESGFVRVSNSTITFNSGYGLRDAGGAVSSYGNNRIAYNTQGTTSGTIASLTEQ